LAFFLLVLGFGGVASSLKFHRNHEAPPQAGRLGERGARIFLERKGGQ